MNFRNYRPMSLSDVLDKKGISSMTISHDADFLMEKLEDENTTSSNKIRIGDYFCRRIYTCLRRKNAFELIQKILNPCILNGEDIPIVMRLSFLKWLEERVVYELSKYQYDNQIPIGKTEYLQIIKVLARSNNTSQDLKNELLTHLLEMFEEITNLYVRNNIAEVVLHLNWEEGQRLLEILRELRQNDGEIRIRRGENRHTITLYTDSQNVHAVNDEANDVAKELLRLYQKSSFNLNITEIERELDELFPDDMRIIHNVLTRIQIDTTIFNCGGNLCDVFKALWVYILNHRQKTDLYERLITEFREMEGYCSTGHMSRLINVIQGFTGDNDKLNLRIKEGERLCGIISYRLNKAVMDNEKAMDAIMECNDEEFGKYVAKEINNIVDVVEDEEKVTISHTLILQIVKKYAPNCEWTIENNRIALIDKNVE